MKFIKTTNSEGNLVQINPVAIVCIEHANNAITVTLDTAQKVTITDTVARDAFTKALEEAE